MLIEKKHVLYKVYIVLNVIKPVGLTLGITPTITWIKCIRENSPLPLITSRHICSVSSENPTPATDSQLKCILFVWI